MSKHELKVNLPDLLKILSAHIYSEPASCIRELIQNAHDSCIIRRELDPSFNSPCINITVEKSNKTICISDNGAGMTENQLHNHLSVIGNSFTKFQTEVFEESSIENAMLLIGRFGIGLLSAFSAARSVMIETLSYESDKESYKWVCKGDINYEVTKTKKNEVGTSVTLELAGSGSELILPQVLISIIKKYADFLTTPIYLNGKQINVCLAPWENIESALAVKDYIRSRFNVEPLIVMIIKVENPIIIEGLLFIPEPYTSKHHTLREVDIYIKRMFIKEQEGEALPDWANFIKGIINVPEFSPTVSRNDIKKDELWLLVRDELEKLIIERLKNLKIQNKLLFSQFVACYNNFLITAALQKDAIFDLVADLVTFRTNNGAKTILQSILTPQMALQYTTKVNLIPQTKLLFKQTGMPIIYATGLSDERFLKKYCKKHEIDLSLFAAESSAIFKNTSIDNAKWATIEKRCSKIINKKVRVVDFEPKSTPAILVPTEKEDPKIETNITAETIKRLVNEPSSIFQVNSYILNLNLNNQLIKQLAIIESEELFRFTIEVIYENARIYAQQFVAPEQIENVCANNFLAYSKMVDFWTSLKVIKLEENSPKSTHIIPTGGDKIYCFFAYPFEQKFHRLRGYITKLFSEFKYNIILTNPALSSKEQTIYQEIESQVRNSHFGIVDITTINPNVLFELGLLAGADKKVIILKDRKDQAHIPSNISGHFRIDYETSVNESTGEVEYAHLRKGLERHLTSILGR